MKQRCEVSCETVRGRGWREKEKLVEERGEGEIET